MANDFWDDVRAYMKEHPQVLGLIFCTAGIMIMWGAWKNWDWLYAPDGGMRGLGGISAYLGRSAARIAGVVIGISLVGASIVMFCSDRF
ncbi:Immunity protein 17 [Filimonas lacunae]|uniref:Immunity protein 17 n=1 Tax=Filimonas lacunae TaxID=477680 RepID=A0A173MF80_9BACT|nr:immunity 17 family protein [Filimonas lacunae]BAV06254.1 hypothetical protein FLA_2270 [Filimonas lacunae]SIT25489.1 Immunity protein 17 [Filimonas lacunae]